VAIGVQGFPLHTGAHQGIPALATLIWQCRARLWQPSPPQAPAHPLHTVSCLARLTLQTLPRVQGKEGCCRQAILNASVADFFREHQLERLSQWTTTDSASGPPRTQPVVHCNGPWARQCAAKHHLSVVARKGQEPRDRAGEPGGQERDQLQESAVQACTEAKASGAEAALARGWVAPTDAQAGASR